MKAVYRLKRKTVGSVTSICSGRSRVTVASIFQKAMPVSFAWAGGSMLRRLARRVRIIFLYVSDMHITGMRVAREMKIVHH